MNLNTDFQHSAKGISFGVTKDDSQIRPYGISAVLESDSSDCATADGLFFTEVEAEACCKWLAENEVYPITLTEVLENLYVL